MKKLGLVIRWSLLFLLTSCGGGSCSLGWSDPPAICGSAACPTGADGGRCRSPATSAEACDPGLVCYRNVCRPCGGPGERCCFEGCDGTLACEPAGSVGDTVCSDCGELGERCCSPPIISGSIFNVCNDGSTCDGSNRCVGGAVGPCGGPSIFTVGCEDALGCGAVVPVRSTSQADAEECARASGACATTHDASGLQGFEFCLDFVFASNGGVSLTAFDDAAALRCAQALSPARCYWNPIPPDTTSATCLDDCTPCPGPGETPPTGCTTGAVPL